MGNQQERLIAQVRLAMLYDTEGWISMNVIQRMKHRVASLVPVIGVTNTNVGLVDWTADVLEQLDVPRYVQWVEPHGIGKLAQGRVTVAGLLRVKQLLPHIRPFLIVKGKQADLLKEFIESRLSTPGSTPYTERELEIANEIRGKNTKGRGWRPISSTTLRDAADELRRKLNEPMIKSEL